MPRTSLTFEIEIDPTKLKAGIARAKGELKELPNESRRGLQSIASQARQTGQRMTLGLTLPIVAFGGLVAKTSADFELAMNQVAAVSGATGNQFASLTDQARELGSTTQFSASEAARGMGFLAQAGFKANEILGAMPGTLQLASSAQLDLATTADIVSNILQGYGREVSQLTHTSDVLVKAFTSTNTNLQQLGEAMTYAAPIASAAGVQFEEAAAALGLMGNAGIQASMAGTSLRGVISRILNPSEKAAEAMAELGLTFTDARGRLLPLNKIIQELEPHAKDAGLMLQLFGQRAGPGMAALVRQGSERLRTLTQDLENSGGTAQRVAEVQMKGLTGAWREFKSAFEGLQIAIGDSGLKSLLEGILRTLAEWLRYLTEVNPEIIKWGTVIAGVVAAIGPLVLIFGTLLAAISAITATIGLPALLVMLGAVAVAAGVAAAVVARFNAELGEIQKIKDYATEVYGVSITLDESHAAILRNIDDLEAQRNAVYLAGGSFLEYSSSLSKASEALDPIHEDNYKLVQLLAEVDVVVSRAGRSSLEYAVALRKTAESTGVARLALLEHLDTMKTSDNTLADYEAAWSRGFMIKNEGLERAKKAAGPAIESMKRLNKELADQGLAVDKGSMSWREFGVEVIKTHRQWEKSSAEVESNAAAMKRFVEQTNATLNPTHSLLDQWKELEVRGRSTAEILHVLGERVEGARTLFEKLGVELTEEQKQLFNLKDAALAATNALTKGAGARASADKAAAEAAQELAQETERVRIAIEATVGAYEASINPMAALEAEYRVLIDAGKDSDEVLGHMRGRIIETVDSMMRMAETSPGVAANLLEIREEFLAVAAGAEQTDVQLNSLVQSVSNMLDPSDKLVFELARLKGEFSNDELVLAYKERIRETVHHMRSLALITPTVRERFATLGPEFLAVFDAAVKLNPELEKAQTALEKMLTAFDLSLAPMSDVIEKFDELTAAGKDPADVMAVLGDELVRSYNALKKLAEDGSPAAQAALAKLPPELLKIVEGLGLISEDETSLDPLGRQISTIFTDMGKGLADAVLEWKGFFDTITKFGVGFARTFLRIFAEGLFGADSPLGKLITKFTGWLSDQFTGMFQEGGMLAGVGGAIKGVFTSIGTSVSGMFKEGGSLAGVGSAFSKMGAKFGAALSNPITAAIAGAVLAGVVAWRLFTQGSIEAGSKEITRDFGIDVGEKGVQEILDSLGIDEDQFYGVRKDLLSAPKIMEQFLIPAAKAQGKLEELISRFSVFETSWGTFDLSGPLRDAIATGDFTAYNEAWSKIFADSQPLIRLFGEDYPTALAATSKALGITRFDVDMLIASLGLQGDAARAARDALTTGSTTRTTTTEVPVEDIFGHDTDTLMPFLRDVDDGLRTITTTTTTLTFVTQAQADAFVAGVVAMRDSLDEGGIDGALEALQFGIKGATIELVNQGVAVDRQARIWAVFGPEIKRVVEEMERLGIEVPQNIQDLWDFGMAADAATDATSRLKAMTKRGREAMEEYLEGGVTLVTDDLAGLVVAMDAGSAAFLASGSAADQTQAMWAVFGTEIKQTVEAAQALGIAIPPEIQRIYDWGMASDAAKEKTAALREEWGKVATDLPRYMGDIARGFAGLGSDLKNLTDEELTNVIAGFDEMWNVASGDRSSMSTLQNIAGGGTIFSNLFQRTERLIGQGIDEARHQIDVLGRSVLEAQTSFWTAYGSQITSLFNEFQSHGVEMSKIPADIRQIIDFALQNNLLDANNLDIANNPEIDALKAQIKFFEDEGRGQSEKAMAVREQLARLVAGLVYDPNAPGQSLAQLMEAGNLGRSGAEESQDAFEQIETGLADMGDAATDATSIVTGGLDDIRLGLEKVISKANEAAGAISSIGSLPSGRRPSSPPPSPPSSSTFDAPPTFDPPGGTETMPLSPGLTPAQISRLNTMMVYGYKPTPEESAALGLPQAQTGGYVQEGGAVIVHKGENIMPAAESSRDGGNTLVINLNGDIYGLDDFEDRVAEAVIRTARGGGFRSLRKILN